MAITAIRHIAVSIQQSAVSIQLTPKRVVFIEELSRFASVAKSASPDSRCLCGDIYISSGGNVWIDKLNS
jgi:hypothetical protein